MRREEWALRCCSCRSSYQAGVVFLNIGSGHRQARSQLLARTVEGSDRDRATRPQPGLRRIFPLPTLLPRRVVDSWLQLLAGRGRHQPSEVSRTRCDQPVVLIRRVGGTHGREGSGTTPRG
jgi:hypothetical protein